MEVVAVVGVCTELAANFLVAVVGVCTELAANFLVAVVGVCTELAANQSPGGIIFFFLFFAYFVYL
jgi:hypothetical protein